MKKRCPRCDTEKELNEENFYKARPRKNHPKEGWQSFCKECWKGINKENKLKRRLRGLVTSRPRFWAGLRELEQELEEADTEGHMGAENDLTA